MGKKKALKGEIADLEIDIAYLRLELEAAQDETAYVCNQVIQRGEEIDRLNDENDMLKQTIVDQAVSLFGIVRDAGHQSVEAGLSPVCGGAETPR